MIKLCAPLLFLFSLAFSGCASVGASGSATRITCAAADPISAYNTGSLKPVVSNNPCGKPTVAAFDLTSDVSFGRQVQHLPSGPSDYYLTATVKMEPPSCGNVRMLANSPGAIAQPAQTLGGDRFGIGGIMNTSELFAEMAFHPIAQPCRVTVQDVWLGRDVPQGMQKMPMPGQPNPPASPASR